MQSIAIRSTILSHAPGLAHLYRVLRDQLAALRPAIKTSYGFKLIGNRTLADPGFEKEEIAVFLQYLHEAAVCVDIGANIGLYTCLAASVGKTVIAVEPLPRNLKVLRKNLAANHFSRVQVLPFGLSSEAGTKRLFGTGTCASFAPGWAGSPEKLFHSVPVSTLDSVVESMADLSARGAQDRGAMLIKMDVEGFELEVLSGASMTLNRTPKPVWLIEICLDSECVAGGRNRRFEETFAMFWKCGYEAKTPGPGPRIVRPEDVSRWVAQGHVDFGTHNYIFS